MNRLLPSSQLSPQSPLQADEGIFPSAKDPLHYAIELYHFAAIKRSHLQ
jgi:hypothetical protein